MGTVEDITQWLSTKNAAARLGLSQQYVIKLAHNGTLRAVRTQLGLLIDPASVDEYERRRSSATSGYANPKKRDGVSHERGALGMMGIRSA